jgi:hypothetical protein
MTKPAKRTESETPILIKADPHSPLLKVTGRDSLVIKAGTAFDGDEFPEDLPVAMPTGGLEAGADYAVMMTPHGIPHAVKLIIAPDSPHAFAGFHFAPGGNAPARAGGDEIPAINPCSLWDLSFRPACPDPRGMALIEMRGHKFWADIYLTGADHHINGTSRYGVTIADGDEPVFNPSANKKFSAFDYAAACAVVKHHGKGLLSFEEFAHAAFGVTEKTAIKRDPKITALDSPRTSKFGLMQATGNLWVWGHDGDPDEPRASVLGGSWFHDGLAGSRDASVGFWADYSRGRLGARGRSDHLQLA